MKSSPAGRAGIQAVSLLGAKLGTTSRPAPSAAITGTRTAKAKTVPATSVMERFRVLRTSEVTAYMGDPGAADETMGQQAISSGQCGIAPVADCDPVQPSEIWLARDLQSGTRAFDMLRSG